MHHNSSSEKKESSFVPFSQSILEGVIRVEERGSQRKAVSIRESAADSSREIRMEEKSVALSGELSAAN